MKDLERLAHKAVRKGRNPERIGALLADAEAPIMSWLDRHERAEALSQRSFAVRELRLLSK